MLGDKRGIIGDAKWKRKVSLLERDSKKQVAMHMAWGARCSTDRDKTVNKHLRSTWSQLILGTMLRWCFLRLSKIKPAKDRAAFGKVPQPQSRLSHWTLQSPNSQTSFTHLKDTWKLLPHSCYLLQAQRGDLLRSLPVQTIYYMILWHSLSARPKVKS